MQQVYIIGIDIGTGSTKAVAVAKSGDVLGDHQVFYPENEGHSVQNPAVVWDAFVACINNVVGHMGYPPDAIVLSSAMHSIMAVDSQATPLSPLITWADPRASDIASNLYAQPLGKELYEACGTPIHALSPLCKIVWWREHDAALFQSAHKFIGIKEWIWHRLFGFFEIDFSLGAATGMMELASFSWHSPALEFASSDTDRLSQLVPTTFQRNALTPHAASLLDLPANIPFYIGASDGCLANLGTGALHQGIGATTVGTSGAVRVAATKPCPQWPEQLFNYYLDEGWWITGGAINNGGAAISWAADLLFANGIDDVPFDTLSHIEPGAKGLMFLPYLMGERAPIWDSASSAAFIGLQQHHNKQHLIKAVLEGVCFALRSVLEPLEKATGPVHKLHLSGGFAKSETALQLFADCTGKEVVRLQTADASAMGAAYLGFKALGWVTDFDQLPLPVADSRFLPDGRRHQLYNRLFSIYQDLYPVLRQTMHRLHQLR
ncbi:gluconokinase [Pseudocnuella soli]|uniref:gluconokinase n=1 Tax=Pseudocnuella soli TaxID=2502779 RepID=UPI00104ABCAA|nr:gluconokinase [Pseudocnuella soli]